MKIPIIFLIFSFLTIESIFPQWITQDLETVNYAISFVDLNTGYVAHSEGIKKTINGGENWSNITIGLTGIQRDVQFLNAMTGFSVSFGAPENIGWISKTTNGGLNWIVAQDNRLFCVYFVNSSTGFTGGRGGRIMKTTNTGLNWTGMNVTNIQDIMGLYFLNTNTGFAVYRDSNTSGNGGILKTTDGCSTWSDFNTANRFNYIFPVDANTMYATGYYIFNDTIRGKVYRTSNQGGNWNLILNMTNFGFNCVNFTNISTGYIGGALNNTAAVIYKTTNQGQNWLQQWYDPMTSFIFDIDFVNENTGWSAGYYGIRKTTNGGGIVSIYSENENLPNKHQLFQNYPNPFNPVTKIKFSLYETDYVNLEIYDILGKVVNVIVNQKMNKGSHNVSFDAKGLSTGIYFYRLSVGNFNEIKKMVLVK